MLMNCIIRFYNSICKRGGWDIAIDGFYRTKNPLVIRGALELLANLSCCEYIYDKLEKGESLLSIEVVYAQRVFDDKDILYGMITIIANIIRISKVKELLIRKGMEEYLSNLLKKNVYDKDMNERIKFIKDNLK